MTSIPTFATRPSFLGLERSSADAAICVAGIPFDLGTSNRPGARFGPASIRQASRMLVDGDHPASWAEIEKLDLADVGDFRIAHGDIEGTLTKIEEQAADFGTSLRSAAITRSRSPYCAPWRAARARSGWCISMAMSILGRRASGSSSGMARRFTTRLRRASSTRAARSRSASARRCTATSSTGPSARA